MKKNLPLGLLLIIYLALSVPTYLIWNKSLHNYLNGDEPHYLVMASGIGRHGSFEQTLPYTEEFQTRKIFIPGLAPLDAIPTPENTHAARGPHGLYNKHNIGLPLMLALPFLIGGVIGARIFMVLLGGLAVVVAWKISGLFSTDRKNRFYSTLATSIGLPLIPAANQIYSDLPAGVIALGGIYWFMTTTKPRSLAKEALWAGAIAFLPWLQIKFAATCVLLVAALAWKIYRESKNIKRISLIVVMAIVSVLLLGYYNYYAFGKISGPYQSGSLEASKTSFMVFLGLLFDQNQGFLLQNPIMFLGLFSLGALWARSRATFLLGVLVFLSLIVPNSMHPNWYGGGSFSGRFGWSAAIVFFAPTLFGLVWLYDNHRKSFWAIMGFWLLLQAYFFCLYTFGEVDIYNQPIDTWLENYSIYYFPISFWLPALYNASWAYGYAPNYAWLVLVLLVVAAGFSAAGGLTMRLPKTWHYALTAGFLMVVASGFFATNAPQDAVFAAKDLPSHCGQIEGDVRVATQGADAPGYVSYGPYLSLRRGSYQVAIKFSSNASVDEAIGHCDIYDSTTKTQMAVYPLRGTGGTVKELKISFALKNLNRHIFEFRSYWNGVSGIQLYGIELTPG